jgi:hypothetical protein
MGSSGFAWTNLVDLEPGAGSCMDGMVGDV